MVFLSDTHQPPRSFDTPSPTILRIPGRDAENVSSPRRFVFPKLPPPSAPSVADDSTGIVWPVCDSPAVVRACAELAAAIHWRLVPDRSVVLALTSPGDDDGKTDLARFLAPELVQRTSGDVLVVDADFCKADLSRQLTTAQATEACGDASAIHPTSLPGLYFQPNSPIEDISPGCIQAWRRRWPLVLLDVPSLEHAEPTPLMRRCDGVYLVVRLGHTARRAVTEAAQAIYVRGGRLLGCVLVDS